MPRCVHAVQRLPYAAPLRNIPRDAGLRAQLRTASTTRHACATRGLLYLPACLALAHQDDLNVRLPYVRMLNGRRWNCSPRLCQFSGLTYHASVPGSASGEHRTPCRDTVTPFPTCTPTAPRGLLAIHLKAPRYITAHGVYAYLLPSATDILGLPHSFQTHSAAGGTNILAGYEHAGTISRAYHLGSHARFIQNLPILPFLLERCRYTAALPRHEQQHLQSMVHTHAACVKAAGQTGTQRCGVQDIAVWPLSSHHFNQQPPRAVHGRSTHYKFVWTGPVFLHLSTFKPLLAYLPFAVS